MFKIASTLYQIAAYAASRTTVSTLARCLLKSWCKVKLTMKINNIVPPRKLPLLSAAICAVMLAFSQNASALRTAMPPTINTTLGFYNPVTLTGDPHVVGTVSPGAPASAQYVKDYINFMIGLSRNESVAHNFGQPEGLQTIYRTNNIFGSLPTASGTGAVPGAGTTIDLNALGTFTYLFAKYDGRNDNSVVWNIAGLTGILTIPQNGPRGYGLSGWILFGPTGTGPTGTVPDGGATVMLLGAALGALGMARRYLMS
jgi:hypothetical protein